MPTYSYACTQCGNRFDAVQAFTDDALTNCDQCSGRLRKLFGSVGVVFKGSGFYRTDSREAGRTPTNGAGKSSSSGESHGSGSGDKSGSADKTSTSGDKSNDKPKAGAGSTTAASTSSTSS